MEGTVFDPLRKKHVALTPEEQEMKAKFERIFGSIHNGSFFSITYTVPTSLAKAEYERTGKTVATMYFAVEGLFEGIAAGIATGFILVNLKAYDVISLLPIIVAICCAIAFGISFVFPKSIKELGKGAAAKEELKETETV